MLNIVTRSDKDLWNKLVASFKGYDVYYLLEYLEAFYHHGDGEPLLFYYETKKIRAINVVMKREIPNKNKITDEILYDLSTPYGYGGFLVEGKIDDIEMNELDKIYTEYCINNNIVSEFCRFHPVLNNVTYNEKIYETVTLGKTVTIPLKSVEDVWQTIHGKNRNVIRKAKKQGVDIFWGRSSELIDEFVPMYNETMGRDQASSYYYFEDDFYKSILNDLKYNHLVFYAMYQEKIISMAIIIFSNNQVHYHLSASNREYQHLSATNLLLYEVACWASNNGFETLHLGGGLGSKEDNLYKFKSAFNKKSNTTFSIGKKVFDFTKYEKLVEKRIVSEKLISSKDFFPLYRA